MSLRKTIPPTRPNPMGATNNLLGFLGKLSNIDKHRYLNIVVSRVRRSQTVRYASGLSFQGFQVFEPGKEYMELVKTKQDRAVYVNRRFAATISFHEVTLLGDPVTFPVDHLLKITLREIRATIVPAFERFIE